jgi:hypothetical protein
MKPVQAIYDDSKTRRAVIFQRDDGSFGFEEQKFSDEPRETAWIPVGRRDCRCDTIERALAEVRGRVDWLSESG